MPLLSLARKPVTLLLTDNFSAVGSKLLRRGYANDLLSCWANPFRLRFHLRSNHMQCLNPNLEFLFDQVFISQLLFLVGDVGIPKIIDAGNGF